MILMGANLMMRSLQPETHKIDSCQVSENESREFQIKTSSENATKIKKTLYFQ